MRKPSLVATSIMLVLAAGCSDGKSNEGGSGQAGDPPAQAPDRAAQQAADGTITATLNGEKRTWYVLSREMGGQLRSQSEWANMGQTMTMVTLFGHDSADSMASKRALSLEFNLMNGGGQPNAADLGITYIPEGGIRNLYTLSDREDASVTVTGLETSGDELTVSGRFSGTLHPAAGAGEPAELTIENGSFQATVHKSAAR